jgi:hypothetical protein
VRQRLRQEFLITQQGSDGDLRQLQTCHSRYGADRPGCIAIAESWARASRSAETNSVLLDKHHRLYEVEISRAIIAPEAIFQHIRSNGNRISDIPCVVFIVLEEHTSTSFGCCSQLRARDGRFLARKLAQQVHGSGGKGLPLGPSWPNRDLVIAVRNYGLK